MAVATLINKYRTMVTVIVVNLTRQFTTTFFDPSPDRFSQDAPPVSKRKVPLVYSCENCGGLISFSKSAFKKHCNSEFTNLSQEINEHFERFARVKRLTALSSLDFYCPDCGIPTKFLFQCGPSGFWGEFFFEIKYALVLKSEENR